MKMIIPIETKKWWQIWKKSDQKKAKEKLHKLLKSYAEEIPIDEDNGPVEKNNQEGFHKCPYCGMKSGQINDHFTHMEFFHHDEQPIY